MYPLLGFSFCSDPQKNKQGNHKQATDSIRHQASVVLCLLVPCESSFCLTDKDASTCLSLKCYSFHSQHGHTGIFSEMLCLLVGNRSADFHEYQSLLPFTRPNVKTVPEHFSRLHVLRAFFFLCNYIPKLHLEWLFWSLKSQKEIRIVKHSATVRSFRCESPLSPSHQ